MAKGLVSISGAWLAVVVAFCVALTGCRSYEVVMPETAAGRICADQCSRQQQVCVFDAETEARRQTSSCESHVSRVERKCERIYVQGKDVERCEMVNGGGDSCPTVTANTSLCGTAWRSCVVECGGRVIEH